MVSTTVSRKVGFRAEYRVKFLYLSNGIELRLLRASFGILRQFQGGVVFGVVRLSAGVDQ